MLRSRRYPAARSIGRCTWGLDEVKRLAAGCLTGAGQSIDDGLSEANVLVRPRFSRLAGNEAGEGAASVISASVICRCASDAGTRDMKTGLGEGLPSSAIYAVHEAGGVRASLKGKHAF
jgi:hypothetical protein